MLTGKIKFIKNLSKTIEALFIDDQKHIIFQSLLSVKVSSSTSKKTVNTQMLFA